MGRVRKVKKHTQKHTDTLERNEIVIRKADKRKIRGTSEMRCLSPDPDCTELSLTLAAKARIDSLFGTERESRDSVSCEENRRKEFIRRV